MIAISLEFSVSADNLCPFDVSKLRRRWMVHEAQVVPRDLSSMIIFQVNAAATLALYIGFGTLNFKLQTSNFNMAQVFRGSDDCNFFRVFLFRGQLVPFDVSKPGRSWIVHEARVVPREFKQHDYFQVNAAATLALYIGF